jgi:hypothetical protein
VSAESPLNTFPNPFKVISGFESLGQLFKIPPLSAKKSHSAGGRGVPDLFWVGIITFLLLRSPCKISKPYDNPSGRISNEPGRGERETNAIYSGHLRLCQQPRAAHALHSDHEFAILAPYCRAVPAC